MEKLWKNLADNAKCYTTSEVAKGYQGFAVENFKFKEEKLTKKVTICFDDDKAYVSNSNSTYHRLMDHTFVSFHKERPYDAEVVETIQLDFNFNKYKYTKSIYIETKNYYFPLNNTGVFVADLIEIPK